MSVKTQPAIDAVPVDISSTDDDLSVKGEPCSAFYIGGAGDLQIVTKGGRTVTFVGLSAGAILPVGATSVKRAGTTATNIVALYT